MSSFETRGWLLIEKKIQFLTGGHDKLFLQIEDFSTVIRKSFKFNFRLHKASFIVQWIIGARWNEKWYTIFTPSMTLVWINSRVCFFMISLSVERRKIKNSIGYQTLWMQKYLNVMGIEVLKCFHSAFPSRESSLNICIIAILLIDFLKVHHKLSSNCLKP